MPLAGSPSNGSRLQTGRPRSTLHPPARFDAVRLRRRRFHPPDDSAGPPPEGDANSRWLLDHPQPDRQIVWPYFVVMILPWLMWGVGLLLVHLGICAICVLSGDISVSPGS